jgi:hypothetical protein
MSVSSVLCVVTKRSLRRADHSSEGVLASVVRLSMIVKPRQKGGPGPQEVLPLWGGGLVLITLVFNCLIMASVVVRAENRNRIVPNTKQNG